MFPPVEDSVLQANPNFANLYANLTTNILNPSGSTKHHSASKEWAATKEELRVERIKAAKHHIIRGALQTLDISSSPPSTTAKPVKASTAVAKQSTPLPPELIELILLLSSHLNSPPLETSSQDLLQSTSQWLSLQTHLPTIGRLLSNHIQSRALQLARILFPTTNASYLHRQIPKLVSSTTSLQGQIDSVKEALYTRRNAVLTSTLKVLALYQQATTLTISTLERTTHGALSRHLKAKSEYLALQASTVSLLVKQKEMKGRKMVYTFQVQKALETYSQHLRVEMERIGERGREAERVLWGYGVGRNDGGEKEKIMREVARVYGELKKEIKGVERDVGRLKGK